MGKSKSDSLSINIPRWAKIACFSIGLIGVVFLLYSPLMQARFVWDDDKFLISWPLIKNLGNWPAFLAGELPRGHMGVYRPLRTILQAISYHFYGTSPSPYHIQAIVLHAINTLLVFGILGQISQRGNYYSQTKLGETLRRWHAWPFLGALYFAIHPVQVEAIAFISASFDVMGITLALGSVFFFLLFFQTKRIPLLILSYIVGSMGFFVTELTLALPLLIGILSITVYHKIIKKTLLLIVPFLFVILCFFLLRQHYLIPSNRSIGYINNSPYITFLTMTKVVSLYSEKILVPFNLSPVTRIVNTVTNLNAEPSEVAKQHIWDIKTIIGMGILIFFAAIFLLTIRQRSQRHIALSIALIAIGISPVSNVIPGGALYAERYLYLGMLGISMLFINVFFLMLEHKRIPEEIKGAGITLFAIIFFLYATRTFVRTLDWQNSIVLWAAADKVTPNESGIMNNLGLALGQAGDATRAYEAFGKSQQYSHGRNPLPFYNMSLVLKDMKKNLEAVQPARAAYILAPKTPEYILNLATLLSASGNPSEAQLLLATNSSLLQSAPNYWYLLGNISIRSNDLGTAEDAFRETLLRDPSHIKAATNLGAVYNSIGSPSGAIAVLEPFYEKGSVLPDLFYNLASAYNKLGQKEKAFKIISIGKQVSPSDEAILTLFDKLASESGEVLP